MTGASERPSWSTPETRKADENRGATRDPFQHYDIAKRARRALAGLCKAELALLAAAQQAERAQASATVGAAIDSMLASAMAAVSADFAARRALVANLSPIQREAAIKHLAGEQAAEIARLVRQFATERRSLRHQAMSLLAATHRAARRSLSTRLRRERAVFAILLRSRQLDHPDAWVQPNIRHNGRATLHLRRQRP